MSDDKIVLLPNKKKEVKPPLVMESVVNALKILIAEAEEGKLIDLVCVGAYRVEGVEENFDIKTTMTYNVAYDPLCYKMQRGIQKVADSYEYLSLEDDGYDE